MLSFMYIPGPLKCLLTSGSIKTIDTTNSLFLRVPFSVFYIFVKHKRNLRLKHVLVALVFRCLNFYMSSNDHIAYNNVRQKQSSRDVL